MIENKNNLTRNVLLGFIFVAFVIVVFGLRETNKQVNDEQNIGAPGITYQRNLLPEADLTYDLGSSTPSLRWKTAYIDALVVNSCSGAGCGSGSGTGGSAFSTHVTVTDGTTTSSLRSDGLYIATSTTNLAGLFNIDTAGIVTASGSFRAPNGTIDAPGFTFNNQRDIGFALDGASTTMLAGFLIQRTTTTVTNSTFSPLIVEGASKGTTAAGFHPQFVIKGENTSGAVINGVALGAALEGGGNYALTLSSGNSGTLGEGFRMLQSRAILIEGTAGGSTASYGTALLQVQGTTNNPGAGVDGRVMAVGGTIARPGSGTTANQVGLELFPFAQSGAYNNVTNGSILKITGDLPSTIASTTYGLWVNTVSSTVRFDSPVTASTTLNASTGNEVAYKMNYTTNKATSGNDTGLEIGFTDRNSPGVSDILKITYNGAVSSSIRSNGNSMQLMLSDGASTAPAIGMLSDSNGDSGIYFVGSTKTVVFVVDGSVVSIIGGTTGNSTQFNFNNQNNDFDVDGDNVEDLFYLDATTDKGGINGTTTPWADFSIEMDTTNLAFVVSNNSAASTTAAFAVGGTNANGAVMVNTSTIGINQKPGIFITDGRVYHGNLAVNITANGAGITTNGELVDCGAAACVPSALKYKTSVTPYKGDVLALYRKLVEAGAISNYQLKDSKGKPDGDPRKGLIADVVEKVDPDLVGYTKDGEVNTLHFEDFTGLSVKAIDQLNTRLNIQEDEINLLKKRIKEVQSPQAQSFTHIYIGGGILFLLILIALKRK